ncbi:MAG: hypothetical protein DME00_01460 [Candidatus Rokuibacteriota bacterium]|nr:MAG: hypothetical protein DME00_01460 [Candidatus Rokubacteria bacterium]PYO04898.1 MAG: hypothetical protein DMD75_29945 [Candidatus Rokubacteria bacterium]
MRVESAPAFPRRGHRLHVDATSVDCHVRLGDGTRVRIQVDPGQTPEVGQRVGIRFDSRQSSVFS